MTLSEILGGTTSRTWWNYIDSCCPTFSWSSYSCSFLLYWTSSTPFHPCSWTSELGEWIREHLVWHSHPTAVGILNARPHCLALCQTHFAPPSSLLSHLAYPNPHSRQANFRCPEYFEVHHPHHVRPDGGRCIWFSGHIPLEFVLKGGPLPTNLVAQVIFLTIWMLPQHHVECLTRTVWKLLLWLKCILWQSCACFEREIPSVWYISFDCPATSPRSRGP